MTKMVEKWTEEEFCSEFWGSVDEFYGRWKENSGGRLPDWEAAIARGKRDGIPPHPAYAQPKLAKDSVTGEDGCEAFDKLRSGGDHKSPEKTEE